MMDDLKLACANARRDGDHIRFVDNDCGEVYVFATDDQQNVEIILSRFDAEKLRDWLNEYL